MQATADRPTTVEALPIRRPAPPLARVTMTFASPADPAPGNLITLQVIVTDDVAGLADWHRMPEAQEAGWFDQPVGHLTLSYRVIA